MCVRITSIDLAQAREVGIKPSTLAPLGEIVVLAGPNGAGKSRILQLVRDILSDHLLMTGNEAAAGHHIQQHEARLQAGLPGVTDAQQLMNFRRTLERKRCTEFVGPVRRNAVFDFFPKSIALRDHRSLTEADQQGAVQGATTLGMARLEQNALSYVAHVERQWFTATHPSSSIDSNKREHAIAERERFHAIIRELLGTTPALDLDQQPTLFGRQVAEAGLSDGQSILLQIGVALHAQGADLGGLVLLLDEPECHLHPVAAIEAIARLRAVNTSGQIWIATHCVPLLASLPTSSIWYVDEGGVSWAGRQPEIVLEGLLGGPDGRERMEEFLRLPAQLADSRFAAECLIAPSAVDTRSSDPQAAQLREFCELHAPTEHAPLKVLDFGAGHGRLLSAMAERWQGSTGFRVAVDYRAFEPYLDESNALHERLEATYGSDGKKRLFRRSDELAMLDAESIDVVVLCNVLHEIPPEDWKSLLGSGGVLARLLKKSGCLLILEDMEIPRGEKAHRFGFLLLDTPHLHRLMRSTENDERSIQSAYARDGRLAAHVVPACQLARTDRDSTVEGLKLLRDTARQNILELRRGEPTSRNGRLHALWTQLLANADLAVSTL